MYRCNVSTYAKPLLILLATLLLSSATSAQVNNCCSIDRQCTTNDEWVSGYYAFRNGKCSAASLQQDRQARQDQNPAQSNNCCFNDWQCSTDAEWQSGYWAFRHDQCHTQTQWDSNGQPRQRRNDDQNHGQGRPWGTLPPGFDLSDNVYETEVYHTDDGTPVYFTRVTHHFMCALFPFLDYCQYPEHYPEIWEDD